MDEKTRKELERAYEVRLMKSATRRRPAPSAAASSSTNAAEALKGIATKQQKVARAKTENAHRRTAPVAVVTAYKPPVQAVPPADQAARSTGTRGLVLCGVAVLCLAGLGGLFWFPFSSSGGKHSVSGTLMLDNRPLGGADLFFHPRDRSSDPIRVTTSDGGVFHATDIPAGDYCVSLAVTDDRVEVPKQYRSENSTPFRIQLRRDRQNLRMVASSRKAK